MTNNALARVRDLIELEIGFYRESNPPERYRFLCRLCGIQPRHEVITEELTMLLNYLDLVVAQEETAKINDTVKNVSVIGTYTQGGST